MTPEDQLLIAQAQSKMSGAEVHTVKKYISHLVHLDIHNRYFAKARKILTAYVQTNVGIFECERIVNLLYGDIVL